MKRNPVVVVGAVLVRPRGVARELAPVRFRTLAGICRRLMVPALGPAQGDRGRRLLRRLLDRTDRLFPLEIITGVVMAAELCGRTINPRIRCVIAVVAVGTDPKDYPIRILHEPFHHDLADPDEVSALVAGLLRAPETLAPEDGQG